VPGPYLPTTQHKPTMNNRSVRNWLVALGLISGLSVQSTAVAQATSPVRPADSENSTETVTLEKFEVTGSRIKRLDMETPSPVVNYSTADIEAKGYTNIGDFVQSLPFNTGSANSIYQTASFLRGAATANIRGLGSQRFLTLVDGRRTVPYALTNSGGRSVFDFNSLPMAAIDSVEFLKDGAAAIYGSDAISGVLNIKLKKNFSGLSLSGLYGNTLDHDSGLMQFSAVAGSGAGKTRMMAAVDVKSSNSNFLRDYDVTTTDYSTTGRGINQNSTLNYPANLSLTRAQAAAVGLPFPDVAATVTSWTYVPVGGALQGSPSLANFRPAPQNPASPNAALVGNENRYNFAETYQRYPAYTYSSAYANFEHDISDTLTAFAQFTFSDNFTYYAFTPGVIQFATEGLTLPVASPYNPFGIALTSLTTRTNFGPVRKFDNESIAANFLGGLKGTIADRWGWEAAASHGFNRVNTISRNAIRATTYQAALNGTLAGFVGSYLNPFGPSSNPGITNALFTTSTATARAESTSFDANVSGSLPFDLPGGEPGIAVGGEFRNEVLTTNPDTAAYLGSGGGQPLSGERDVYSAYVELTVPVFKWLELQAAGRFEDYSDFGNTTKPKFAAKVRLPENKIANVILRASYSESFQAPALGLLYQSQTIAFSSGVLQDPLRPQDPAVQQRIVTGGNPGLLPEEADSTYAGIVLEDIAGIKGFEFNVDYFDIKINQVIVTPSAAFLLSERGRAQFPNAIIRDTALGNPGPILRIESVPSNNPNAYQVYKGFDLGFKYRLNNTRYGDFQFSGEATRILEIGSDSGLGGGYFDNVGLWNNPKWRGSAGITWRMKNLSAGITGDYIGSYFNDAYTVDGWPEGSYSLFSGSVSYRGFLGTTVTLGVNNLFDKQPPFNGYDTSGFDPNTYSAGALGRFVYVRIRKDF
jgi:iron complex outermembrane receptor protein